jgi:enediyne polyketide synthase
VKIAIVGIGCRYPGAQSAADLIENLAAGRRHFRRVPPERWAESDYFNPDRRHPDTTYSREAAFVEGFEFDPAAFRIPQRTYAAMDQAHWLALQTAQEALADARLGHVPGESTAVVLGNTLTGETSRAQILRFRWPYARRVFGELLDSLGMTGEPRDELLARVESRYKAPFPEVTEDSLAGGLSNTIAGRISNHFHLNGGAYTVDGACSSSLLAVIQAASGLLAGDFDVALAGGVDVSLDPFELVGFAKVGALSDDDIRVYDQQSRGFLPGEGCGIVVLKRFEDAVRDGDRIYAALAGWGISSDGKGGLTAPSVEGQVLAMERAYARAGYTLADVSLLEGHGTGTPVGDEVELSAISECMRRQGVPAAHACGIGSVKSNIGHTKAAAGVAGLIKIALSAYYRVLLPTQGIRRPHAIFSKNPSLYPLTSGAPWPEDRPIRASVSSAGFGGINTHVTLDAGHSSVAPALERDNILRALASGQDCELFVFSAPQAGALADQLSIYAEAARRISRAELTDLAALSAQQLGKGWARAAVVASTPSELAERLDKLRSLTLQGDSSRELAYVSASDGLYLRSRRVRPMIVFVFPGQGSQRLNATRLWRDRWPAVRESWDRADAATADALAQPLSRYVFRARGGARHDAVEQWTRELTHTAVAQPAIVAASMAWIRLLTEIGVSADLTLGHSLGEYTALWYAGALSDEGVLGLVARRGHLMGSLAGSDGAMLSVSDGPERVAALIAEIDGFVEIANYNAPQMTVVAGEVGAIERLQALCARHELRAVRLSVSGAFHSRMMRPAAAAFEQSLEAVTFATPRRQVISTCTGEFVTASADLRSLLARQIVQPVRFQQAVERCLEAGADLFVEIGPAGALQRPLRSVVGDAGATVLALDPDPDVESAAGLMHLVAYAFTAGLDVRPSVLYGGRLVRPLRLPYAPRFIASPCETVVPPLEPLSTSIGLPSIALRAAPRRPAVADAPLAPAVAEAATEADVLRLLQKYIHSEFGYPETMVHAGARLAEDLNLDSIKSVEVVAVAMGRLGIKKNPEPLLMLDLGTMARRLHAMREGGGETPVSESDASVAPEWIRAFEPVLVSSALGRAERSFPDGPVLFAARPGDGRAEAIGRALVASGVRLLTRADAHPAPREVVGAILVAPEAEGDPAEAAAASAAWFETLVPALQAVDVSRPGAFAAVVLPTRERPGGDPRVSPGAGALKSFALEHRGLTTRSIRLESGLPPAEAARHILAELCGAGGHADVALQGGERSVVEWRPAIAARWRISPAGIGAGDVVLVSGGGKGITARLAGELARAHGVRLALVGRSAPEDGDVAATLAAMQADGIDARYFRCDVADRDRVREVVASVVAEMGPVAGLLHGAGVNTPRALRTASLADLRSTLQPKLHGLAHLLAHLDAGSLRWVAALSSVIGDSGMAGNADYAYANEGVTLVLQQLREARPQVRVLSYAFSVWDEIGMGVHLGSLPGLRRMGIDPIPPAQGTKLFLELLEREWPSTRLVVASRMGGLATMRFQSAGDRPGRLFQKVVRDQPGVELVVDIALHPERDAYLREHNFQGTLLMPAVIGLEMMAQIARAAVTVGPGEGPIGAPVIENARFERPVVVPQGGRTVRVAALVDDASTSGPRRVHIEVRSEVNEFRDAHFSCDVVWSDAALSDERASLAWPRRLPFEPRQQLYGSLFFQGPMFQNLDAYHSLTATSCQAIIHSRGATATGLDDPLLGAPEVRDAFLHSIQPCVPEFRILPVSFERLQTRGGFHGHLRLSALERLREGRDYVYDIEVRDEEGCLVELLHGFRCRAVEPFNDEAARAAVLQVHALSARAALAAGA